MCLYGAYRFASLCEKGRCAQTEWPACGADGTAVYGSFREGVLPLRYRETGLAGDI